MSETETRAVRDVHDALAWRGRAESAEAELSRLRGVVEALADDMETQAAESTPVMGEVWTVAAREVRRALAPVSSSGEAESGEAVDRVTGTPAEDVIEVRTDPDAFTYGPLTPAPVSSGGQAGRADFEVHLAEGQDVVVDAPPAEFAASLSRAKDAAVDRLRARTEAGGQADGEGEGITADDALDEVERRLRDTGWSSDADDRIRVALLHIEAYRAGRARPASYLAARPVLSREALFEKIADSLGEMPEARNVTDISEEQTTVITADVERIASHLADVLAGGQR